jgi:hypothetical protein
VIEIDDKIVSQRIFTEFFLCDLNACKGACCVEGDSGAPLEESEKAEIEDSYEGIKKHLRPEGIAAIEHQGKYVIDNDGDLTTPLIEGKECAYTIFDSSGKALCGIEKAHRAGDSKFLKPISCHLYPIRTKKFSSFEALNYDEWEICKPACECGAKAKLPVFKFLKAPLIRKYGEDFYTHLEAAAKLLGK